MNCTNCNQSKNDEHFYKEPIDNRTYHICIACCTLLCKKQCKMCKEIKIYDDFYSDKRYNRTRPDCKLCTGSRKKQWRIDNNERYKEQAKQYRNRPEIKEQNKIYQKDYYLKPGVKEKKLELARINDKKKYNSDVNFKIKKVLRVRLLEVVKNNPKSDTTLKLLGCDLVFFKNWINYQFSADMNWQNHGNNWHMDHVKPCASFDFSKSEDQIICFNWKNIRPLNAEENILKSDKYDSYIKFKHELMLKSFIIQNKIKQYL